MTDVGPSVAARIDDHEQRITAIAQEVAELRTLIGYDPDRDQYVTVIEAARRLGRHESTLRRWGIVTPGRGVHISHLPGEPG